MPKSNQSREFGDRSAGRLSTGDRPGYDQHASDMRETRAPLAERFADQILRTTRRFRSRPDHTTRVLDVGSGYGHTALALARHVHSVVGIEPSTQLYEHSIGLLREQGAANVEFRNQAVESLEEAERYDLVVLDNVYEHLPNQRASLAAIYRSLAPGGALYLLTPNRLWPIEVHYGLPFLSYLPLPIANWYLRMSGRGEDYQDASYAPTYWALRRALDSIDGWTARFVLPADLRLTMLGDAWHYRLGAYLICRFPALWAFSKAFLVVATKDGG